MPVMVGSKLPGRGAAGKPALLDPVPRSLRGALDEFVRMREIKGRDAQGTERGRHVRVDFRRQPFEVMNELACDQQRDGMQSAGDDPGGGRRSSAQA